MSQRGPTLPASSSAVNPGCQKVRKGETAGSNEALRLTVAIGLALSSAVLVALSLFGSIAGARYRIGDTVFGNAERFAGSSSGVDRGGRCTVCSSTDHRLVDSDQEGRGKIRSGRTKKKRTEGKTLTTEEDFP